METSVPLQGGHRTPTARAVRRILPIYPLLLGVAYWAATTSDGGIAWTWIWRIVVTSLVILVLIQVIASVLLRSADLAAPIALGLWFWLLGESAFASGILIATLLGVALQRLATIRRGHPWVAGRDVTRLGNLVATVTVLVTIVSSAGVQLWDPRPVAGSDRDPVAAASVTGAPAPDIFVVLLDGYPRWDTLASRYSIDDEPFLADLGSRGFDVARSSRSNYNFTPLSLTSTLQMQHVSDVASLQPPLTIPDERRAISDAIAHAPALDAFRARGYDVMTIASPFPQLGVGPADRMIEPYPLNSMEIKWLDQAGRRGPLGPILRPVMESSHRDGLRRSFDELQRLAPRGARPRLVFAHIMAPHPPFLVDATGHDRALDCEPACGFWDGLRTQLGEDGFDEAAAGQIAFVNDRLLAAVDAIEDAADTDPVIVLWSDHGGRSDASDEPEMLRNFFAARTPGHDGLFGDDPTPVSIFPRLLGAYAGVDVPEPAPRQYVGSFPSVDGSRLDLRPIEVR